jgi:hypothetical protein
MGRRHGPQHGLLARPMGRHGTQAPVPVPARHEAQCRVWAAGLAHGTARARAKWTAGTGGTGRRGAQLPSPLAQRPAPAAIYKRRAARVPHPPLPSRLALATPHPSLVSRSVVVAAWMTGSLTLSLLPAPALLQWPRSFPSRLRPPSPICPNLHSLSDASSSSRSGSTPVPSRSVAAWILELAAGPTGLLRWPHSSLLSLPPPAFLSPPDLPGDREPCEFVNLWALLSRRRSNGVHVVL